MKRPTLLFTLLAATLFLAAAVVRAEDMKPAATPAATPALRAKQRADELLKRFDKNGDGKLDEEELADARETMLKEQFDRQAAQAARPDAPELRAKTLAQFDKNHDGRLDDDERAEMRKFYEEQTRGGQRPGLLREFLLVQFDKNADGKIDDAEMADLEKTMRPRLEQNPQQLQRFDKNGDGKIDDTEWAAAREQLLRLLNNPPPATTDAEKISPKEEQARLERIAAEIQKRRAVREAAQQQLQKDGNK